MNNIYEVSSFFKDTPLVSVICSFKDSSKQIEECLSSLRSQYFNNFELLLIDDGSSDDSIKIVNNFLSKNKINYRLFLSKENVGVPKARNFLIKQSSCEYFAIQDSDDIMLSDRLGLQYEFLNKNKDIGILGGHAIKIDLEGNEIGTMSYPPAFHDDILKMMPGKVNPIIDPTSMMRKNLFFKVGMYSTLEKERLVQDFDLWIKSAISGINIANLQKPLIKYRVNPIGLTQLKKNEMIKAHVMLQFKYASFLKTIKAIHEKAKTTKY